MKINTSLLILIFVNFSNAQKRDVDLNNLLTQFYSEVSNQNANKALRLSKNIDSLISISEIVNNETLAIYNNSKGFIYFINKLDPVQYLKRADSLNNSLTNPIEDITIFSSFILGLHYYESNEYIRATEAYLKIVDFKNISKNYYSYKSEALEKVFLMQRIGLNTTTDSTQITNTAQKLIEFKKVINDTLNISYGKALDFIGNKKAAENIFLQISNLSETEPSFLKYNKFQALNWLANYYYSRLGNYNKISRSDAKKLIRVSEELLSVVENTDIMKTHQIFEVYGDIVVASIITGDGVKMEKYESLILKKLNSSNYLTDKGFNLKRFYYILHKLKMYFEIYKNYEKAKFYAYKNVELTKFLYGEVSSEHEQELRSYENIIRLKMFDYDKAYQLALKRDVIIKELYGENSIEYLDILTQRNGLLIGQYKYNESLKVAKKAYDISKNIDCENDSLCVDAQFTYLEVLNLNGMYEEVFDISKNYISTDSYKLLFRLSQIRRDAYFGLKNYLGVNVEFEWILEQIKGKEELLINDDLGYQYFKFLQEYQKHLTKTGRIEKALSFSEKKKSIFLKCDYSALSNMFNLNFMQILIQLNRCEYAMEIIEAGNILIFDDLDDPKTILHYKNQLNIKKGMIYSCLGQYDKSIEAYEKAIYEDVRLNFATYMELSRLYSKINDTESSSKYIHLLDKSFVDKDDLDYNSLLLLVDIYQSLDNKVKVLEYLTALSTITIDDICAKSFYSFEDNNGDMLNNSWILKTILAQNSGENYSYELAANANLIADLYMRKIDFFGEINLGIQKLELNNHPDAIHLKQLKYEYNINPSKILKEEINQKVSKIIGSRIVNYNDLCKYDYNGILNSIEKTEIVANLISFKQEKYNAETYAITFHRYQKSDFATEVFLEDDKKLQTNKTLDSSFYDILFRLFQKNKKGYNENINTFFIIPSGKSNFINFSALSIAFEEQIGREVKIHVISSLSDISKIKQEKIKNIDDLILIGDIDYHKSAIASFTNGESSVRGIKLNKLIEESEIPIWGYLPGTKEEIENIKSIALKNDINTVSLTESEVTESNLKNVIRDGNKNKVLHIATHGFFFPDKDNAEADNLFVGHDNPLLRSGLILSGANQNWNKKNTLDFTNDGILTAEDISFMDLSNVELVVLSACDTGLGDVTNLEGINGLQRAFKLAGANKLIMSLWKVPDQETAEFFNYFYTFLLKDKMSINRAFKETQKVMHKKYAPYYWASFVLLE